MNGVEWTNERVERAKQLNAAGKHPSEIALDLGGVSRNAVIGKLRRIGVQLAHAGHLFGGRPRKDACADRALTLKFKRTVADNNRHGTAAINIKVKARKKQIEAAPTKPLPPSALPFLGLTLEERGEDQCRFPRGENPPFLYCGQPIAGHSPSYCGFHHSICYTKPATQEQREEAARQNQARAA